MFDLDNKSFSPLNFQSPDAFYWPGFKENNPSVKKTGWDGYLTAEIDKADESQTFEEFYKETAEIESKIISCYY